MPPPTPPHKPLYWLTGYRRHLSDLRSISGNTDATGANAHVGRHAGGHRRTVYKTSFARTYTLPPLHIGGRYGGTLGGLARGRDIVRQYCHEHIITYDSPTTTLYLPMCPDAYRYCCGLMNVHCATLVRPAVLALAIVPLPQRTLYYLERSDNALYPFVLVCGCCDGTEASTTVLLAGPEYADDVASYRCCALQWRSSRQCSADKYLPLSGSGFCVQLYTAYLAPFCAPHADPDVLGAHNPLYRLCRIALAAKYMLPSTNSLVSYRYRRAYYRTISITPPAAALRTKWNGCCGAVCRQTRQLQHLYRLRCSPPSADSWHLPSPPPISNAFSFLSLLTPAPCACSTRFTTCRRP